MIDQVQKRARKGNKQKSQAGHPAEQKEMFQAALF